MPGQALSRVKKTKTGVPFNVAVKAGNHTRTITEAVRNRAYEIFERRGRNQGDELNDWLQAEAELLFPMEPRCMESGATLVVSGELQGFDEDEIEVTVEGNRLIVAAERKPAKSKRAIPASGTALRILKTFELPATVTIERATAVFNDGKLSVIFPKVQKG